MTIIIDLGRIFGLHGGSDGGRNEGRCLGLGWDLQTWTETTTGIIDLYRIFGIRVSRWKTGIVNRCGRSTYISCTIFRNIFTLSFSNLFRGKKFQIFIRRQFALGRIQKVAQTQGSQNRIFTSSLTSFNTLAILLTALLANILYSNS